MYFRKQTGPWLREAVSVLLAVEASTLSTLYPICFLKLASE